MLGKLIKYEFRSTLRYYLPLYAALIVVSLLSAALLHLPAETPEGLLIMSMSVYILLAIALAVTTFVVIIIRFYRNLLGQEGYLMFSLPVTAGQNILGKLIPAVCWCIGSVILGLLTVIPLVSTRVDLTANMGNQDMLFLLEKEIAALVIMVITLVICCVLSTGASILFFYLCMSIGQTFNEHKLLASFAAYLIIQTAMQILGTSIMFSFAGADFVFRINHWFTQYGEWFAENPVLASCVTSVILLVYSAIYCLIPFLITRWLLTKKLNLA